MDVSIRNAIPDDITRILEVFTNSIYFLCSKDYTQEQIDSWLKSSSHKSKWKGFIDKEYFIVAENNNVIIGFASLANSNHINLLFVDPNHARNGIASLLLNQVELKAQYFRSTIITTDASITAYPFFQRNQYKLIKKNIISLRNNELINYTLAKKLQQ